MSGHARGEGGADTDQPAPAVPGGRGATVSYAGAGLEFALALLLFAYAGQWLDRRFGTAPWVMVVGIFLGGGGALYGMVRRLGAAQARDDAARRAAGKRN